MDYQHMFDETKKREIIPRTNCPISFLASKGLEKYAYTRNIPNMG